MEYNFSEIEKKWQQKWLADKTFKAENQSQKPKYYVLDMFPYPSGSGLHVGHPLGYIASDIYSRYMRLKGFNVLHPMGYDAYGLPAEQYAIQTGQHPAITTENNIKRYREQLDKLGLSFDWDRSIRTDDTSYYKWTQWGFIQLFSSYYCYDAKQARPISELIECFTVQGSKGLNVACTEIMDFSAEEWKGKSEKEQQEILMNYRLAYLSDAVVNWCAALGTVLANDEVVGGVSVRGGHPVERKLMKQWSLRITAYAQRLLDGLDTIDWSESLKEIQRNWIGRSEGAMIKFHIASPNLTSPQPPPMEGEQCSAASNERVIESYGYVTTDKKHWNENFENAKEMRRNPTEAEDILWRNLRNKNINELKFRRQHLIDQFIVDFVCLEKSLIVEVDGEYHNDEEQKQYDKVRTQILNELGFDIVRFTNDEILHNINDVLAKIKSKIAQANTAAVNSPSFGGGWGEVNIFTTRPDTIFGVSFMVLSPEHELNNIIVSSEQKEEVEKYISWAKNRSERERLTEVKKVTGVFTGAYAVHPFSGKQIPIWVSDYVLAGYGTGAIMAVPAHDSRDFAFARHFNLPIIQVIVPKGEQAEDTATWEESKDSKEGTCVNSDFINGMEVKEAISEVIKRVEDYEIGTGTINYRLRDAIFSRQRYWGEPFPMYYKDGMPYPIDEKDLPLCLPEIDKYLPTETGEPPLARAKDWTYKGFPLDCNTMPGFAGSNAYYIRYMDPHNDNAYVDKDVNGYWKNVDLYMGGSEHATGHLLYSRMWNKFLFDLGIVCKDEPFQKLINQGMIQGRTSFVYRERGTNRYISYNLRKDYQTDPIRIDISLVDNDILDIERLKKWRSEFKNAEFVLEDGKYICGHEVEKMSKSYYNVQNPDDLVEKYGADTLRMYEMFLGPLEQSKPWDIKGIEGVFRFIRKFWKLYHDNTENDFAISEDAAVEAELKILHKTIKKIQDDIEKFSFNTSISAFMICINELTDLKCNKRAILEPLCILIAPFAPHLAEELWQLLGHGETISYQEFPTVNESYLQENTIQYPVSFNGKTRFMIELGAELSPKEVEDMVLNSPEAQKWLEGKAPKKVIVVPKRIVNIVL